jgi:hypothetical protein
MNSFPSANKMAWAVLFLAALSSAGAQAASCFSGSQAVSADQVKADEAAIKADAAKWFLARGGSLTAAIRDLAASDPDFAATIVSLAKGVSAQEAAAIGAGLGQAAGACSKQPDDAAKIQSAVAASSDQNVVASYASTTGNTQTAATGGGGAGGGGGGGVGSTGSTSGTTTGRTSSGVAAPTSSSGVTNGFTNLLTGGTAASISATSVTTISGSVSKF